MLNLIKKILIVLALLMFTHLVEAQINESNIKNTSSYIRRGKYDWKIYIEAPPQLLRTITKVEYTLHPTFKDTLVSGNPGDRFSYSARGWGEFYIYVNVYYSNKRSQRLKYWLKL